VWALDFQFDSTIDGKAIKIASMIDEHTRVSLLHLVERSITAERLVAELEGVFAAAGGAPMVLRMDNGPELIPKRCNSFVLARSGCPTFRRARVGQRLHRIVQQQAQEGVSEPQPLEHPDSKPAWSSATSRTSTITGTAIQRWATSLRPSTLPVAGTPTYPVTCEIN
jgi:hypothetical protein